MNRGWLQFLQHIFDAETISTIIIGLAGGVVALKFEKDRITVGRGIILILSGVVAAIYLGSALCEWLSLNEKICDGIKFIVALSSMRIFEGIMTLADAFKNKPLNIIKTLFTKTIDTTNDDKSDENV